MFGVGMKTPISKAKQVSDHPKFCKTNPFDSDSESEAECSHIRTPANYDIPKAIPKNSPYKENEGKGHSSSSSSSCPEFLTARDPHRSQFHDSAEPKKSSMQKLENYALSKAQKAGEVLNNCLKIVEDIKEDAARTLFTLQVQGEQITRSHSVAADIDHDLSRGEKLLGSLGGIFSKTWKPKITRPIKGPVLVTNDLPERKGNHLEQREQLGLSSSRPVRQPDPRLNYSEVVPALDKIEVEKVKQDDILSDLSNSLSLLKDMTLEIGIEIDRHNKSLDNMHDDVDALNSRVKGANQRARRLLGSK